MTKMNPYKNFELIDKLKMNNKTVTSKQVKQRIKTKLKTNDNKLIRQTLNTTKLTNTRTHELEIIKSD